MAISKKLRQQVYQKYNGLCAYTGKPLDEKWQVDHMTSKFYAQKSLVKKQHYKNKETGEEISIEDYKIQTSNLINNGNFENRMQFIMDWMYVPSQYKPIKDNDNIENLLPAISIINHYKRAEDLEGFRKFMLSFHTRLKKLPKKTLVPATERRIIYMNKVAGLFDITVDKPFSGVFYFETAGVNAKNFPSD